MLQERDFNQLTVWDSIYPHVKIMPSAASQLALKSAIEHMFTWTSSSLRKPAAKDKLTSKHKNVSQVVMTPDCIPKFFIPSLDVAQVDFHLKSIKISEGWWLERRLSDVINSRSPSAQCNSGNYKIEE